MSFVLPTIDAVLNKLNGNVESLLEIKTLDKRAASNRIEYQVAVHQENIVPAYPPASM